MAFVFHGLIVLIYFGLSLLAAFALPQAVPEMGTDIAMFAAGGLLLVSALLHQGMTNAARTRQLNAALRAIAASNTATQGELREARVELKALAERPLMAADPLAAAVNDEPSEAGRDLAASLDDGRELEVLKTLFAQLPRIQQPEGENADEDADIDAEEAPVRLSGNLEERLAAIGAAAAPTARAATARRNMVGESDYRRHLVTSRPASLGRDDSFGVVRPIDPAADTARADAAILSATRDALERARVTLFVQPIVSLPNRRTRYYETYSRIRSLEGEMIGPEHYLRVASQAGLIAAIDNNLLFRCVQLMRRLRQHERNYGFFCNVSPHTVGDSTFFPQFVEFLGSNAELAGDIVFEFTQSDIETHYDSIAASLGQLERLGYRFSLDQVARYDVNFRALADRHFRFIKLNAKAMLELRASPEGRQRIDRLLREARNAGVAPIVEKIETERQLIELLDFPFPLGQGYLFGVPKESRVRE